MGRRLLDNRRNTQAVSVNDGPRNCFDAVEKYALVCDKHQVCRRSSTVQSTKGLPWQTPRQAPFDSKFDICYPPMCSAIAKFNGLSLAAAAYSSDTGKCQAEQSQGAGLWDEIQAQVINQQGVSSAQCRSAEANRAEGRQGGGARVECI